MWPDREMHPRYTDSYFNLTRKIVQENGDAHVTYAVFMRRPVTLASKLAIDWLLKITEERGVSVKIEKLFKEGGVTATSGPHSRDGQALVTQSSQIDEDKLDKMRGVLEELKDLRKLI